MDPAVVVDAALVAVTGARAVVDPAAQAADAIVTVAPGANAPASFIFLQAP